MTDRRIRRVVVVGGGTAGWMAAAVLAKALGRGVAVTVVESEAIGTVGVGEATIPQIKHLNAYLGLDEPRFLRETAGSFKLGISFEGWSGAETRYIHAFGEIGTPLGLTPFHHYWLKARAEGDRSSFWDHSLSAQAAARDRYAPVGQVGTTRLSGTVNAYHFDAHLYGQLLRRAAEGSGAERVEGRIVHVRRKSEDGYVTGLDLEGGRTVEGDFFVDCSGFRSMLLGEVLGVGFDDWSDLLPCDRAIAAPSAPGSRFRPYTQAMARPAGWQWRIPLQTRVGNGHVHCSAMMSEDEATALLLASLEGEPLAEPRTIAFRTGMRKKVWERNVVALGLAAGFMEPLESTSIHLVQSGVERLVASFPDRDGAAPLRDAFNARTRTEFERIRDFLVMHYHLNARGEPFWRDRASIELPETLRRKLDLFRSSARFFREDDELFTEIGWVQVMLGQGVVPEAYAPSADALPSDRLLQYLADVRGLIAAEVDKMPSHERMVGNTTEWSLTA
jgi:tryptophan halogenase